MLAPVLFIDAAVARLRKAEYMDGGTYYMRLDALQHCRLRHLIQ